MAHRMLLNNYKMHFYEAKGEENMERKGEKPYKNERKKQSLITNTFTHNLE